MMSEGKMLVGASRPPAPPSAEAENIGDFTTALVYLSHVVMFWHFTEHVQRV